MKRLAAVGALLLVGGILLLLAGALVWTNNARHGAISPAVYWGFGIAVAGLLTLIVAGAAALLKLSGARDVRSPR